MACWLQHTMAEETVQWACSTLSLLLMGARMLWTLLVAGCKKLDSVVSDPEARGGDEHSGIRC